MIFDRFFKKSQLDPKVTEWLKAQSHPEDAILYLIEKELYEHGDRDLSYVVPRKRSDAYFADLLDRESYEDRHRTNMAMYDAISQVHEPDPVVVSAARPAASKPKTVKKTIEKLGTIPTATTSSKGLSTVNKSAKIYNTTSSAVVVTGPEDDFEHDVDLSCFED